jgi:hypothetical protein
MKVLFMSGYVDGTLDAKSPFVAKPIRPEALARRVREVLDE